MSRRNKLLCRSILDAEIWVPPAYQTRTGDNVHIRPTIPTFNNAYQLLCLPSLTSKTQETALQVLNRTIWTNNKHISKMRNDPDCERCGCIETMEHVLCECLHYSELIWIWLGEVITKYLNLISSQLVPRVEYSQLNVIYNVPHPSLLLHIRDKLSRNALLILMQETKRDIIFRRMNLPPSARQITDPQQGAKYGKATTMLQKIMDLNLERP